MYLSVHVMLLLLMGYHAERYSSFLIYRRRRTRPGTITYILHYALHNRANEYRAFPTVSFAQNHLIIPKPKREKFLVSDPFQWSPPFLLTLRSNDQTNRPHERTE